MTAWVKADYLTALHSDATAFRAAATPDTLDSPVPPCPEWTVRMLVGHLGSVYRRITGVVARAALDDPGPRDETFPEDVLPWFDDVYAELAATLREVPDDSPAWNWAPQPKTAAFWSRRAAHETAIHRWDAQVSVGATEPIEDNLAADGVDEVLDTWLPAGRRNGPHNLTGLVHLLPTDTEDEWFVRLRGERIAVLDAPSVDPHEHPTNARATGLASDIDLALYGRVPFDVLTIEGDAGLLAALRVG